MTTNHDSGDADANSPAPSVADPIWASVQIKRGAQGKMWLHVDARELHDRLLAMGAATDSFGRFLDQPTSTFEVTNRRTLAPNVFLTRKYPASFAISDAWATPPTIPELTTVAATGEAVVKQILAHYTPVDIRLRIKRG